MNRTLTALTLSIFTAMPSLGQTTDGVEVWKPRSGMFNRLDISVTGGSTGVGIELGTPVGNVVRLRAGFDIMPRFEKMMNFGIQVGDDASTSHSKFEKMSEMLADMTGNVVDESVDVIGKPYFYNFKFMVDVFPFKKKNWHFTAGFYAGPRQIAEAYNTTEDMPTLFSVSMYNHLYELFAEQDDPDYWYSHDFLPGFSLDPFVAEQMSKKFKNYGRMGVHMGNYSHDIYDDEGNLLHKKDDPYMMEPDANNMVKAYVRTNAFKPYLGFGYGTALNRKGYAPSGWSFSVDAGVWLWGGTPSIVTHDGTDLAKDLYGIPGKVGRYVDIVKAFKVYPVLNLRITKSINFR